MGAELTLRIPTALKEALKRRAEKERRTPGALARIILEDALAVEKEA